MNTFEVRLESPSDPRQHRILSLGAENEAQAKELVHQKELALCEFNLHPPAKEVWEDPHLQGSDDARVDLSLWDAHDPVFAAETAKHTSHEEAKRAAQARLENWASRSKMENGKLLTTLGSRSKARYAAHLQQEPFQIVDVRSVSQAEVDANRLVREARQLAQFDPAKWQKVLDQLREGGIPLAAVTASLYGTPTKNRCDGTANGQIDWHSGTTDTFKTALTTSTYTVNLDTHTFFSDITNEATGTGWSAGGVSLGTFASLYDATTDQARYDAADISAGSTTVTFRNLIVYKSTGTGTTSPLIGYINAGAADVSTTSGTLSVVWDTTGVWLIDVT